MQTFKDVQSMQYNHMYELDYFYDKDGYIQKLYLVKTHDNAHGKNYYYLKLFLVQPNGEEIQQGYLYFFIGPFKGRNSSKYIGTYVKPEYRNTGIASLLTSSWIKFCLDNDLDYLSTNQKQRKPFLLYLLKTFTFEIEKPEKYDTHPGTIYICKSPQNDTKILLFKNNEQRHMFERSSISTKDNYKIIDKIDEDDGTTILDKVILNQTYELTDNDKGYSKALAVHQKHK